MKRIFAFFLSFLLILGICPMSALADTGGSGNVDGGGGSMGQGTSQNSWNPGMDGVRITVVDAESGQPVSTPFDLTNKNPTIKIHFGKISKIQYSRGTGISPTTGNYDYYTPAQAMPRIISTGSTKASIEAIKKYFCSEYAVELVAQQTGINYDELIGGEYKLLLEPMAYFKHNGVMYAMTAHEAALYDNQTGGALRRTMTSLTHKNLPLAMYLEYSDLGFAAYSGPANKTCSNDTIIAYLGMGIVRFEEQPPEQPEPTDYDYEYRVDTDVITSVEVSGGQSDPDNPVTVQFVIEGSTYTVSNVYYPDGDSQLVWVKWHTPDEPCVCTIQVRVLGGGTAQSTITANIVDLDGNDPHNPVADDRNDGFTLVSIPEKEEVTSTSWGIWSPWWQENWVWVENWEKCWHTDRWTDSEGKSHTDRWYHWVDNGWWEDQGWWEFDYNGYSASLSASMTITPDGMSPTASATMAKSGYGIQQAVTANVSTTQSSAVTAAQNAVTYFPEFNYEGFWRLLDRSISGKRSSFAFKNNPYSTYNRPTHFTPIWYPDGSYTPYTWLLDCWTPAGMLSINLTDSIQISGDLWEDWHIAPTN